jgi:hypothetical protein
MRLLASTLLFISLVGCAAQQHEAIDISRDPSWIPPGQGELAIADSPEPKKPVRAKRPRALEKPNHRHVPAHLVQVGKTSSATP